MTHQTVNFVVAQPSAAVSLTTPDGLPEEIRNEALQLRGEGDETRWRIGDFVNDALGRIPHGNKTENRRKLADLLGLGASTVRKYQRCSLLYDDATRQEFQVLTHACFYAAAPAPAGVREELLFRAIQSADDYGGQPAGPDLIKAWVAELRQEQPETDLEKWLTLLDGAASKIETALGLPGIATGKQTAILRDMLVALEKMTSPEAKS